MKNKNVNILNEHIVNKVKFLRTKHNTINDKDKDLTLKVEKPRNNMNNTNELFNLRSKIIKEMFTKEKIVYDKHDIEYISKVKTPTNGKTTFETISRVFLMWKHPLAPPFFAQCAISLDMTKVSAIANYSIGSSHMLNG